MHDDPSQLKSLGAKTTEYFQAPSSEILETFPNKFPGRHYTVVFECPEFTSLCPKTGQPDFARIIITYIPKELCIESKSLKLYLFSFRNEGSFMETITNRILEDLMKVCPCRQMTVEGEFNARGGIGITVVASFNESVPSIKVTPGTILQENQS